MESAVADALRGTNREDLLRSSTQTMAVEFKLPALGENIKSAHVVGVLVSVGATVTKDQPLLEVESEKATVEVPSPVGGTIQAIHVRKNDEVKVGQVLMTLEAAEGKGPVKEDKGPAVPAPEEKVVKEERPTSAVRTPPAEQAAPAVPAPPPRHPAGYIAPATPSVRRLARELGVDINQVTPPRPTGRITEEDVKNYARQALEGARAVTPAPPPLPDFTRWGEVERKPMTGIRRTTAEHVTHAWTAIPHVTHYDQADITELEKLRKQYAPRAEEAGGKLTVTAIVLKAAASALKTFPQFNASLDLAKSEIIYKKYCHIGVAVDTERGLLVPVIRDVDKKSLLQLSVELTQVAERARARKLALEEMQGGTFTVTNLGGIGGTAFSPIINAPEVAILGIARARLEPVWRNERFEPRLTLPLCLSYDHRLIDGADAARFLRAVIESLQQPFLLALNGMPREVKL